jgi:hypothetical protein
MDHLIDRELTDYPWRVFQCGHYGWYYTNGNSVIQPKHYATKAEAQAAMEQLQEMEK